VDENLCEDANRAMFELFVSMTKELTTTLKDDGEKNIKPLIYQMQRSKIVVNELSSALMNIYPAEFLSFVKENGIKIPNIDSGSGKALAVMLHTPDKYWTRSDCDSFAKKFNINTTDSIQLFNKHEQRGIKSSTEKGKYYIPYPYQLSNKHAMRKNFKYDGTEAQKNLAIEKIKSTIKHDYIDPPNSDWQIGHKNPESTDNSSHNLVLQPPIQAKYRDQYVFIDTLTKMPTPEYFGTLQENGKLGYTKEQLQQLRDVIDKLLINY
jgi:hypothetical protein